MAAAATTIMPSQQPQAIRPGPAPNATEDSRQDLPRPYKCPLCDKAFHRLEHQTRHIRTHTGEKPHACNFPGCTKRFSRSDELTRHSRIHNNPHSRRGPKAHHGPPQMAPVIYAGGPHMDPNTVHMVPQANMYTRSAPNSSMVSPEHSPPHSYTHSQMQQQPSQMPHYYQPGYENPQMFAPPQQPGGMNILATAATQVEREHEQQQFGQQQQPPLAHIQGGYYNHGHPQFVQQHPHYPHSQHYQPYPMAPPQHSNGSGRLPSISAYAYSTHSMSRSNSQEGDEARRPSKRSKPNSPESTAPTSPNFSNLPSHSSTPHHTPGHTPAITPSHSPRLHPSEQNVQLPGIKSLTLGSGARHHSSSHLAYTQNAGAPDTMEPTADANNNTSHTNSINSSYNSGLDLAGYSSGSGQNSPQQQHPRQPYNRSTNNSGLRISEIISQTDGDAHSSSRTLPAPVPSSNSSSRRHTPPGKTFSIGGILNGTDGDVEMKD